MLPYKKAAFISICFLHLASLIAADKSDPIASPDAIPGGKITLASVAMPKSLNYYLDNNTFSAQIFSSLYESLLSSDPITAEHAPGIASHWEISEDKKQYTFHIDPLARWSDGCPITAQDVLWTFAAITAPTNQTGPHKVYLATFMKTPPQILDDHVIRFTAEEAHWRNLNSIGGFAIMPKHIFEGRDFNKINSEFPVVSGPYQIASHKEGVSLSLKRRSDWWARARSATRNTCNFDEIVYRFYGEADNAFDAFLNGQIDVYPVYSAAIWTRRTNGKRFDSNWIVKRKVRNHHPVGFQGFAMNMRKEPFDDLRVRQALAHLLDRNRMNETLMHSQYFLHRSYFEGIYDSSNLCSNTGFDFAPEKAEALLDEAGWKKDSQTGLRMRDGKVLEFTFLSRDGSADKFLALYSEDLRKAGVRMKIDIKDWAAWSRDMAEFKFDMTWAAWSSGIFVDPESMWASEEADRTGGNNITGFKDETVDGLIEEQRTNFNLAERNAIMRRIDAILTREVPYILLWNTEHIRLLYWDKFGMPSTVLSKYGDEGSICSYWWYDPDSDAELLDAIKNDEMLPPRPDIVDFDQTFRQ